MNKEQRQRLSELIREIRGERSLRELARELEVSAVSVNSWEKGDSVPGIESLDAIAQFLIFGSTLSHCHSNGSLILLLTHAPLCIKQKILKWALTVAL
jgi:transcriptional regulator with XRE-family HTH domain